MIEQTGGTIRRRAIIIKINLMQDPVLYIILILIFSARLFTVP